MSTLRAPTKIISTYHSLVMDKLNRIYDAWANENYTEALSLALMLAYFLPPKDYENIKDETTRIINELGLAEQVRAGNYHTTRMWQGKYSQIVAFKELANYMRNLIKILDDGDYIQWKPAQPRQTDSRKLTVENE